MTRKTIASLEKEIKELKEKRDEAIDFAKTLQKLEILAEDIGLDARRKYNVSEILLLREAISSVLAAPGTTISTEQWFTDHGFRPGAKYISHPKAQ